MKNAKIEAIEVTLLLKCVRGVVSADRVPFFESFEQRGPDHEYEAGLAGETAFYLGFQLSESNSGFGQF